MALRRRVALDRLAGLPDPLAGLAAADVAARRLRYGGNEIVESRPGGWLAVLADTARDPMLWFLLGTAGLFLVLGEPAEAAILALAILPLLAMDAFLHRRTRASTEGLASRLAARAVVRRDGEEHEIPVVDVVPGDLARVAAGEPFPADGVVVAGEALQADESALTGESLPVRKRALGAGSRAGPSGWVGGEHWGLAGSRLLTGDALLRVVFTGAETLYGEIVRSARAEAHERTPLQASIASLVNTLLAAAAAACLVLAGIRLRQGFGPLDALLSAATLAVAAIPEEFPVVFAFFLGVGVYRLARRQALVRRGVVVENIGRVTCICTDKTGTMTEGRLRVAHLHPDPPGAAADLLAIAALASRSESGDPVDAALLDAAGAPARAERLLTFPFTEQRRRETAVVRTASGGLLAACKGAPETVLAACALPAGARAAWSERVAGLARAGHKVLACAQKPLLAVPDAEPTADFGFAGLVALEDPLRPGVADAVRDCRAAGIRVLMVTGDHAATAGAIARDAGLGGGAPTVVEGEAVDGLTAAGLARVDVVARALPQHKLALVRRLQADGHLVAVTGDGVNDVPALQRADIGIAMGGRGTRSAREAAAVVLLDDDFGTIVRAIAEGRQLFANLQRSFAYLLMLHLPLVATAAIVPFAGLPLLYLPIHVVWLELILHPTALLAFQGLADRSGLERAGGGRARPRFFARGQALVVAATGLAVTAAVLLAYVHALGGARNVPHARAMALLALVVAGATMTVALGGANTRAGRWIVAASVASALLFVTLPALADPLHLQALHASDLALAVAGGALAAAPAFAFGCFGRRTRAAPGA